MPPSGLHEDPSHTDEVCNVSRSEAEDLFDQEEDDQMMVDEDAGRNWRRR